MKQKKQRLGKIKQVGEPLVGNTKTENTLQNQLKHVYLNEVQT